MSVRTWWRHWSSRHRWLISYPPEVDDAQSYKADPAHDPFHFESGAERSYESRGRLGDKEYREDQIDT